MKNEMPPNNPLQNDTAQDSVVEVNPSENIRQSHYRQVAKLIILAGLVYFTVTNIPAFFIFLQYLLGILAPVMIGLFLAFTLNLPLTWLETKVFTGTTPFMEKVKRPLSLVLSILLFVGLIALVVILVIPQSVEAIQVITKQIPSYYDSVMSWIKERNIPWLTEYVENLNFSKNDWSKGVIGNVGNLAGGLFKGVSGVLGGLLNAVLGLSFAGFMLVSKEKLLRQVNHVMEAYMTSKKRYELKRITNVFGRTFHNYIIGQVTEAIVMGVLTTSLMLLLGFPYATVIGPLTGLSSLIPMIGAFLGGGVGFLLILTVNPVQGLLFLLFITTLQQLDGMFIYPRIVGNSVELPPLWVFFAVTIGGALFGFIGTFLGVPVLASIYQLMRGNVAKRRRGFNQRNKPRIGNLLDKGMGLVETNQPDPKN